MRESEIINHLVKILTGAGWSCQCEVPLPGVRLRPDLVIRHPMLPFPGIVECKAQIRETDEATAAFKQASDYVGRTLPDGEQIAFGAVCPWQPKATAECGSGCLLWGMLHIMATQFKVFAFMSDEQRERWHLAKGMRQTLRYHSQRLLLLHASQDRVWCSERGFVGNAVQILGGKRQIGGVRANPLPRPANLD